MRRLLIAVFASSLALALIAPTAQGVAKVRHLTLDGQLAGQRAGIVLLGIDYLVKHKNGHERLIPRRVTSFSYLYVPVSCDLGPGIADFESHDFGGAAPVKITKKRFAFRDTAPWGDIQSTIQVNGHKMWQGTTGWGGRKPKPWLKKYPWKRASGTLNILDFDWPAAGYVNCTTNGPRSWTAHQCHERESDPAYLPMCPVDF